MMRSRTAHAPTAALALVAVLLVACSDTTSGDAAEADQPTTTDDLVVLLDDDSDPDQVHGMPGTYAMTARGAAEPPWAVVEAPGGYTNFGFFALWPVGSADGSSDQPYRSLQYWTVHAVFEDPCRASTGATAIGGSVDDLAEALAAQRRTSTTRPEPVSLDGHDGVTFQMSMPAGLDFEQCDVGYFMLWEGSPEDRQHTVDSPDVVETLWILDVDGERVVLTAPAARGTSQSQIAELAAMVESVRFVDPS